MDETSIYNMALNAVGTRSSVALPTERSREAQVCRLWFSTVRDTVLRAAPWKFAKKTQRLALLARRDYADKWAVGMPDPEFAFAYATPSDMIIPRYLPGYQRFDMGAFEDNKLAIYTNTDEATLVYTMQQTNISMWDSAFVNAVVWGLAGYIAMPLTGKVSGVQNALQQANNLILTAREENSNQTSAIVDTIPSWIAARGFTTPLAATRYIYPTGDLFNVGQLGLG